MKIIRIDKYNGKEEKISDELVARLFTEEQFENLKKGIPQYTFGFVYQLDLEDKGSDYGTK